MAQNNHKGRQDAYKSSEEVGFNSVQKEKVEGAPELSFEGWDQRHKGRKGVVNKGTEARKYKKCGGRAQSLIHSIHIQCQAVLSSAQGERKGTCPYTQVFLKIVTKTCT